MGPEGDPDAQAMWLALRKAYTPAFELLQHGAVFGLQGAHTLELQLRDVAKDTPLTGTKCMLSRDAYIDDYLDARVHTTRGDDDNKRRVTIMSIQVDGVQHDSPLKKEAAAEYRKYAFGVATTNLDRARAMVKIIIHILQATEPENLTLAQSGRGAQPAVLALSQKLRHEAHDALLEAREAFLKFAKRVKRMHAVERLGRKV